MLEMVIEIHFTFWMKQAGPLTANEVTEATITFGWKMNEESGSRHCR